MLRQLEIPRGVWYWCETWSLTLREERTLRLLESGMLRKIFGPKRDEETGEWRRLHNEELIIRRSKLYYTTSGIVTPIGGRPVHRTATYRV